MVMESHTLLAPWIGSRRLGAAVSALLLCSATTAAAQIVKSPPAPGATTHTVVPGERYRSGAFSRWLYGDDYREVWITPIEVPVLDLDAVGGGLTPIDTGGFGQSVTLEFVGADGLEYAVRSMDKDPTKRLLPELKGTFVEKIIQDQISALLPTAGLIVDPLLAATGVLHPTHQLVVVPDDPRLGEYQEEFAGLVGMLTERPEEGPDNTPGWGGFRRISGTDNFRDAIEEGPCDRPDARAYLKARLMDIVIGDRDRHAGQWRWAEEQRGDCRVWLPIPEDRDQAFVDYDGFVMWMYRRSRPQQTKYDADYPHIGGLTFNGWELDREVLVELEWPVWDSVAFEIRRDLTDPIIEDAVRRLPSEHFALVGERLETALKERRDELDEAAREFYRTITRWADIYATDEDEYAELEHLPTGAMEVRIGLLGDADGGREPPYFRRTFEPDVTRQVRLYLRGGDDRAEILGDGSRITARVIGGGGNDHFVNDSRAPAGKVHFHDDRGDNVFDTGRGARVDERPFERPPSKDLAHRYALDWGGKIVGFPIFGYSPDLGLWFGLRRGVERYGFRKVPFKTYHLFSAGLATVGPEVLLGYDGRFREMWSGVDGLIHVEYTGINKLRFYGFGNETPATESSRFFKVQHRELVISLGLEWHAGENRGGDPAAGAEPLRPTFKIGFGPLLKHSSAPTDDNADRFIGSLDPAPYGLGSFGEVGAQAWFAIDTRDNSGYAKRGVLIEGGGTIYPSLWDVESTFGEVHGSASTYLTAPIPAEPTLALRAGGRRVFGTFPFHEAAYLGGRRSLRGFRTSRFAGDAVLFGNAELRFELASFNMLVPTQMGLFGAADAGRVFFDGDPEDADTWHTAFGGGLWLSFMNRLQSLSVGIMEGDDLTGLYIRAGMAF
jgi:hypothetical protein